MNRRRQSRFGKTMTKLLMISMICFFGRSRWFCSKASLIGFLLGALIAGVAFATILTLFLKKEGKRRRIVKYSDTNLLIKRKLFNNRFYYNDYDHNNVDNYIQDHNNDNDN